MANRYSTANSGNNPDLYIAVYEDAAAAEAEDRDGLLTVQGFDSGDFPVMKVLNEKHWNEGEILKDPETGEILTFVVRIQRRKPEKAVKARRNYGPAKPAEDYPS